MMNQLDNTPLAEMMSNLMPEELKDDDFKYLLFEFKAKISKRKREENWEYYEKTAKTKYYIWWGRKCMHNRISAK
jgi:hypothetical protein